MVVRARTKVHLADGAKSLCAMTADENLLTTLQDDVTCKICLNIMNGRSASGRVPSRVSRRRGETADRPVRNQVWSFYYEPVRIGESIWSDLYGESRPLGRIVARYTAEPAPAGCTQLTEQTAVRFYGRRFVGQLKDAWAERGVDLTEPVAVSRRQPFIPLGERTVEQIARESKVRSRVWADNRRRAE